MVSEKGFLWLFSRDLYTPIMYGDGYIVFSFHSSICMFVLSFVRSFRTSFSQVPGINDKVLVKVSQVVYIIVATY